MRYVVLVLAVGGMLLGTADVKGTWTGSFVLQDTRGRTRNMTAHVVLTENAGKITGTFHVNKENSTPIRNGKLEGDRLTFDVTEPEKCRMELRLEGDRLSGKAKGTSWIRRWEAAVDLKRTP